MMLEKDIVNAIMRYLKTLPFCFVWKTHGGLYGTSGLPDVVACVGGQFFAFEVKQPGGRLTKLQEATMRKINEAGGNAYKVTSAENVKEILSEVAANDHADDKKG
jgi:Holliday junction resolvase